jgi:hypothetical protein
MLFAFLVLPHGSSLRSSRNPPIEAGNGQPGRCPCLCSPAGSATARLVEVGTGGRSPSRAFPGRVCLTLAAARQKKTPKPAHVDANAVFIGGYLPKPPNPHWSVYAIVAGTHRPTSHNSENVLYPRDYCTRIQGYRATKLLFAIFHYKMCFCQTKIRFESVGKASHGQTFYRGCLT